MYRQNAATPIWPEPSAPSSSRSWLRRAAAARADLDPILARRGWCAIARLFIAQSFQAVDVEKRRGFGSVTSLSAPPGAAVLALVALVLYPPPFAFILPPPRARTLCGVLSGG
jgi:hypothetical protein